MAKLNLFLILPQFFLKKKKIKIKCTGKQQYTVMLII